MEGKSLIAVISFLVVALSGVVVHYNYYAENRLPKPDVDLSVCILSARENFDLRDAIRNTWLKDFNKPVGFQNMSLLAKFIIGSKPCDIHPDYRISPYSCQAWNPKLPANREEEIASFASSAKHKNDSSCAFTSVSFLTMHDIILKRVGILELFPLYQADDIQVVLYDTVSTEEISRTRFTPFHKISVFQGFKYRPVEDMILPKTFEKHILKAKVEGKSGKGRPIRTWGQDIGY